MVQGLVERSQRVKGHSALDQWGSTVRGFYGPKLNKIFRQSGLTSSHPNAKRWWFEKTWYDLGTSSAPKLRVSMLFQGDLCLLGVPPGKLYYRCSYNKAVPSLANTTPGYAKKQLEESLQTRRVSSCKTVLLL